MNKNLWFSHTIEYWNETENYSSVQHGLYFLRMTITIYLVLHVLSFLDANDMNIRFFFYSSLGLWGSFHSFFFPPVYFLSVFQLGQLSGFFLLSSSILLLSTATKFFNLVSESFSSKISILFFFVYLFAEIFSFSICFRCALSHLLKHCMMPVCKS